MPSVKSTGQGQDSSARKPEKKQVRRSPEWMRQALKPAALLRNALYWHAYAYAKSVSDNALVAADLERELKKLLDASRGLAARLREAIGQAEMRQEDLAELLPLLRQVDAAVVADGGTSIRDTPDDADLLLGSADHLEQWDLIEEMAEADTPSGDYLARQVVGFKPENGPQPLTATKSGT